MNTPRQTPSTRALVDLQHCHAAVKEKPGAEAGVDGLNVGSEHLVHELLHEYADAKGG